MSYNYYDSPYANQQQVAARQQGVLTSVYLWMTIGLLITGAVAIYTVGSTALIELIYSNIVVLLGLFIAELALVYVISSRIWKMASSTATALFIIYAALNGLTISIIFLLYTSSSIASTFFVTAGTFAAMSIYGYTTKRDLSKLGSLLFMALLGLIIASIVNMLLHSTGLYWLITYAGVLIFVGLTAYDTQRIKKMIAANPTFEVQRIAILGALSLYLDFINLFLLLLRIFGRRR
jgi:FtsH-binding integral membrane protein